MSKQDRQGVRTPADLEQKYQFGKKFAELMGIATDARESVDSLASTLRSEMKHQETSIIRDTEKIMLTALMDYAKTDELEEVETRMEGKLTVKANEISAVVTENTKKITAAGESISELSGELTVEAGRIDAAVKDYSEKISGANKEISDLRGELLVEAGRITAAVEDYNEKISATDKEVSDLSSNLTVAAGRIDAAVKDYNEKIAGANKSVSDLSGKLTVEAGRIDAAVSEYTNKFTQVGEDIAQRESDLRSAITTATGGISMTVEENTKQIKENNETVTGVTDKLRADLDLTSQNMQLGFTGVSERFTNVEGDVQQISEEWEKCFDFDANGLTIKAGENAMQLRLDNGIISFMQNGQQFGWWDGVNFHTGSIYVELNQQARIGDFAFVPRSNGSLDFLKVGG